MSRKDLLYSGFLNSVRAFPDRPAITVSGETLTYAQLYRKAASLAATIANHEIAQEPPEKYTHKSKKVIKINSSFDELY
jgi:acyl-CoA synthetase (AMP-forming)/AMP-acid ligase II